MAALPHPLLLLLPLLHLLLPHSASLQQQQQISAVDLAALLAIRSSLTDIHGTSFFSSWDFASPDPCSSFSGVVCSLRRVTSLSLGTGLSDSAGLAGSLSPSIANLTELTQLLLFPGIVTGPIPPQVGSLANLRVISLTRNRLNGPFPASLSSLPNLHTLDLSYNQLTGSVPPDLPRSPMLKVLVLAGNRFSGEFPDVETQLLHLDLKTNGFTGRLPGLPPSIRYLSVSKNYMWGPLNGLRSLSELVYLDLSVNRFGGPIPPSLFSPRLSSMLLQRNNLSGGLPNVDGGSAYGEGSVVDLSHNFLTGELTSVLAGVESLFLNSNRLTGTVPEEYVKSVYGGSTRTLYLQHNYLTGFRVESGRALPDSASLCLSYNCMVPPAGVMTCPASAGREVSRPVDQCSSFKNVSLVG
ncbi:leucine-rich repeat receptor-like serine/threonine-protein kinase BAM2 [Malania oleifera]|uniref:leucine-rich repeat receptor-like serine/threonine-protein kinase BAM2 n=1 Tax=Malania oleifera TaxID=397392 RepID=UPI0025AE5B9D|nr:leucine-rich repeat receptor-like serine/threonine-protein kinase BAM2 [Malania oleifera]